MLNTHKINAKLSWSPLKRCMFLARLPCTGLIVGLLFGAFVAVFSQILGHVGLGPGYVFTGATQGSDEWVYFSLVRAIIRSPNGITYTYPFVLNTQIPPVMFQFPLTLLAWLSHLCTIPAAFEIGRVAGSGATGWFAGFAIEKLFKETSWRRFALLAAIFAGGCYSVLSIQKAISISGIDGLTELWEYLPYAEGPFYYWVPFVSENATVPLECIYHAIMFGGIACLLFGKNGWAGAISLIAWFSNPFTALALSAAGICWWLFELLLSAKCRFRHSAVQFAMWVVVAAIGYAYYNYFLTRWPELKDLVRIHRTPRIKPPAFLELAGLCLPWGIAFVWSILTKAGRRHILGRSEWRLIFCLALSQVLLYLQIYILGESAVQPLHFNRGYFQFANVLLFLRMAYVLSKASPAPGRIVKGLVMISMLDQGFFWLNYFPNQEGKGQILREYNDLISSLHELPAGALILTSQPLNNVVISALSPYVPYDLQDTMVAPFPEKRAELLSRAIEGDSIRLRDLNASAAIALRKSQLEVGLMSQGWKESTHTLYYSLYYP